MATETVPHAVPFRKPTERISQIELALLVSLRNRKKALDAEIADDEQSIIARLEAGAQVEPGKHAAALKENWRKSVAWKGILAQFVRTLGLDGEKYCQTVVDNAPPKRSVSLIVA